MSNTLLIRIQYSRPSVENRTCAATSALVCHFGGISDTKIMCMPCLLMLATLAMLKLGKPKPISFSLHLCEV